MKIDNYTKIMLTIIAFSLLLIALRPFLPLVPVSPAYAESDMRVIVDLEKIGGWSIYNSEGIPVKITNDELIFQQK